MHINIINDIVSIIFVNQVFEIQYIFYTYSIPYLNTSVTLVIFQVHSENMWLMATILNSADIGVRSVGSEASVLLTRCATLNKLLNLTVPPFSHL